jgi:hypothetical protein
MWDDYVIRRTKFRVALNTLVATRRSVMDKEIKVVRMYKKDGIVYEDMLARSQPGLNTRKLADIRKQISATVLSRVGEKK